MILTEDLTKTFDDFTAVDGVNLVVGKGEVLAILGPNGAGKTTTVRMLTSILKPTRGRAVIAGFDVVTHPREVRASVGVLTEHHGLYNRMRPEEYLGFFGDVYGLEKARTTQRTGALLDLFSLSEARGRKIGEFSKGMRQKLALARAMLHDPHVLLLDEPTSAMDPASARLVRDSIKELRSSERTVVICTHNLVEAEELADRIAIIRRGRIIARGTVSELKDQLLGPTIYEVEFVENVAGGKSLELPAEVTWKLNGAASIQYSSPDADRYNPIVLRQLLEQGFGVKTLREATRSLEQVYLQAVMGGDTSREDLYV
ncbi:MAG: ABC transporter ATP-binding protein [Anaerolineae bacterium]|nr:MAG: ABC transporter ATP-binding protein [Anaerolineae bacterium]